jgi:hypothetical protein
MANARIPSADRAIHNETHTKKNGGIKYTVVLLGYTRLCDGHLHIMLVFV